MISMDKQYQTCKEFKQITGVSASQLSKKYSIPLPRIQNHIKTGRCNLIKTPKLRNKYPNLYKRWLAIRDRCYNPNHPRYQDYGGRGIKMSFEWFYNFDNFANDIGSAPFAYASIDRVDNNLGYCVENCRWASSLEQRVNTREPSKNKRNTSGCLGVVKRNNKWEASIKINNKLCYLGSFSSKEQAIQVRKLAELIKEKLKDDRHNA